MMLPEIKSEAELRKRGLNPEPWNPNPNHRTLDPEPWNPNPNRESSNPGRGVVHPYSRSPSFRMRP